MEEFIDKTGYWLSNFNGGHMNCPEILSFLKEVLKSEKESIIYDLGCGPGYYIDGLYKDGFSRVIGMEPEPPNLYDDFSILSYNLAYPIPDLEKGIVISLEVGEHIPSTYQDVFIDNITKICNSYLILSWAVPGQPGIGHVNCLSNETIIKLITDKGFKYLEDISNQSREELVGNCWYFKDTLMVFKR